MLFLIYYLLLELSSLFKKIKKEDVYCFSSNDLFYKIITFYLMFI